MRRFFPLLPDALIDRLGWTLLHFIWQGAALAAFLVMLLFLLRRRSASSRYLVCCAVLLLTSLCPPLTFWAISPRLPQGASALSKTPPESARIPEAKPVAEPSVRAANAAPTAYPITARPLLERLLPWLVLGWSSGVVLLCLRLARSSLAVYRLAACDTYPISGLLEARMRELARKMGIHRPVRLLSSSRVQVPTVIGCMRAVVLLPVTTLTGLPPQQIEALLAHELAHIRRYDHLVNLWQVTMETLLFYHPAIWWVSQQIRLTREQCCDDLAVQILEDRMIYARALTALETLRSEETPLVLASNGGDLMMRIRHILGLAPAASRSLPFSLTGTLLGIVLLTSLVAWRALAALQSGDAPAVNSTAGTDKQKPQISGVSAPVLLALKQARTYYQSLPSFAMRIENHYTSGLFPTEYTQTLRWRKSDQFELLVTSKNNTDVPNYYADGEQLITALPDNRQRISQVKPEPHTSPGWEVSAGLILSWLENTESGQFESRELPPHVHFDMGPRTKWHGYRVRELLLKNGETSPYYPHGTFVSFFLDATEPKLIGLETNNNHKIGWALYSEQNEKPALPQTLGQAPTTP